VLGAGSDYKKELKIRRGQCECCVRETDTIPTFLVPTDLRTEPHKAQTLLRQASPRTGDEWRRDMDDR
jgi:hypothetical protein